MWRIYTILLLLAGCVTAPGPGHCEPTAALLFNPVPGSVLEFGRPEWPVTRQDAGWEGYEHVHGHDDWRGGHTVRHFSYRRSAESPRQ